MQQIKKESSDLFQYIAENQFENIQNLFEYHFFEKGDYIIKENELVSTIYFIKSGLVKLSYTDSDAKESILSFAFEGWWETDFSAFYNETKAVLNLQCIEKTEVFNLKRENYLKMINEFQLSNYFLEKSIKGHIANQNRILSLLSNSPKEKYEYFLKIYPSLIQRIPKTILAQYLGVSRETLSRIYK